MQSWYHRYTSLDEGLRKPKIVTPVSLGYPFRSQYFYPDIISASTITAYYAYLILLNQIIGALSPDYDNNQETFELASAICMSVDYSMHAGYCGTQTMRFSLPIARSVLPVQYHQWTDKWLERFSAIMNATMIQPLYS